MAVQYSVDVRNAMLDAIESTTGTTPKLRIYTGAAPANCAAAASGTLLVEMDLPSDWMAAASGGTKVLAGSWSDVGINGGGNAGHYRITDAAGTTTHEQGTITATGGGGDITLDNISIADAQVVTITSKTITAGNA